MSACLCPDVDVGRATIPSEPLKCGCCGKPLELTCAGECGPKHVRAAFKVPKPPREKIVKAPPAPWVCGRCRGEIPKKRGRAPKYCVACRTPEELAKLALLAEQNEAVRTKRLEATS